MITPLPKLTITVTKTVDGACDYAQIISADQFAVNLVLIAKEIEVRDSRCPASNSIPPPARPRRAGR